ncbi:hypothetical protein P7K49_026482, partial [Saguinus oedipus]
MPTCEMAFGCHWPCQVCEEQPAQEGERPLPAADKHIAHMWCLSEMGKVGTHLGLTVDDALSDISVGVDSVRFSFKGLLAVVGSA